MEVNFDGGFIILIVGFSTVMLILIGHMIREHRQDTYYYHESLLRESISRLQNEPDSQKRTKKVEEKTELTTKPKIQKFVFHVERDTDSKS